MARIGDSCVRCGSSERSCGDPVSITPIVMFDENAIRAMLRVGAELSAEGSYSEDTEDTLYFRWELIDRPVDDTLTVPPISDGSPTASFTGESVGLFVIRVTAVGANGGCSEPGTLAVVVFRSLAPLYEGTALDTSWVWQLLPDFWSKMNREARHKAELMWRGLTQALGSDVTRAFDLDTSKSIRDIQDTRVVRWMRFPLEIQVQDAAWYIASRASAVVTQVDASERAVELDQPLIPVAAGDVSTTCRVISVSVIAVFPTAQFTPSGLDVGASVSVSYAGRAYSGLVAHVSQRQGSATEYVIEGTQLPPDAISAAGLLSVRISWPARGNTRIFATVGGRATTANILGARAHIDSAYALVGDGVEVYPALHIPRAIREGVTEGDTIKATLHDSVSGVAVDILLEVAGVTTDAALVKPTGDLTYSDILDVIAYTFSPRGEEAREEFKAKLRDFARGTVARVLGRRVTSASSATFVVFGQVITLSVPAISVTRRHAIRASGDVRSLGVLREFTEQQRVTPSGRVRLTDSKRAIDMGRAAIDLIEGTGFRLVVSPRIVAPVSGLSGERVLTCDTTHILIGDTLVIQVGIGAGRYAVTDVVRGGVRLLAPVARSFTGATALVLREGEANADTRVEFTPPLPTNAPSALWSEGAVLASPFVERRFGTIVGITRAEWESRLTNTPYIDAVRALYHARMGNQTPYAVARTVAVLLGMPYTPRRAVVRRIDPIGNALRVIVEDMDDLGRAVGSFHVHDIVSADEDGLDEDTGLIDAADGSPISVGSELEPMTVLSRGVSVIDSVESGDDSVAARHMFAVNVTASRVYMTSETPKLMKLAVRASRPAYTQVSPRLRSAHRDDVKIETSLSARLRKQLFDTAYGLGGPAEILDDDIPGVGRVDAPPFFVLTTWFPSDGVTSVVDGQQRLSSSTGGLLSAPVSVTRHGQIFPTRYNLGWIREGDTVQLRGVPHAPLFVKRVISDTELELDGDRLTSMSGVAFQVSRPVSSVKADFITAEPGGAFNVPVPAGTDLRGIDRGDEVVFPGTGAARYKVRRVVRSAQGDLVDIVSDGYTPLPASAIEGERGVVIRARHLAPAVWTERLSVSAAHSTITAPAYSLEPGDVVELPSGDRTITSVRADQVTYTMHIGAPDMEEREVRVRRPLGLNLIDGRDSTALGVRSSVTIRVNFPASLPPSALADASGFTRITRQRLGAIKPLPGDVVHIEGDNIDTGEGIGTWRVMYSNAQRVILNRPFTPAQGRIRISWARQAPMHQTDWRD